MKIKRKNGFTVVELVIIIAVIAILAAVLIPTFSSIVKKASESTDIQTVRNLNTAIKIDAVHHNSMHDALAAAKANGFAVEQVRSIGSGGDNFVAWDSVNDRFVIIKKGDGENDKFIFPSPEGEQTGDVTDKVAYFVFYDDVPVPEEQTYSIYLDGNNKTGSVSVSVGFDVGENYGIKSVEYTGNVDNRNIILRTNNTGTNLSVNDTTNSTIAHFGDSGNQTINSGALSFHEYGGALKATITGGHYVAEGGSIVVVLDASASVGNVLVDLESGSVQGTVKNTNTQNTVTINGKPGAKTISFVADTNKNLKATFATPPTYTNTTDVGNVSDSLYISGVGTAPRSAYDPKHTEHKYVTVSGSSIRICEICGIFEKGNTGSGSEPSEAHTHSWSETPFWSWSGDAENEFTAVATFTCKCGSTVSVIAPKGTNNTVIGPTVVNPGCTTDGRTYYTANIYFNNVLYSNENTTSVKEALGHDWINGIVTEPKCEEAGYTTYSCSRCSENHVDNYTDPLGHDIVHHEAQAATYNAAGWNAYDTCSRCEYSTYQEIPKLTVGVKFPNTDKYLYRVGNQNAVAVSSLFEGTVTNVDITPVTGASGLYSNGNITFSGTGVVKVTANSSVDLYLEVVDAINATTAISATNNNVVLLNDVSGTFTVSNGYSFYGNGFTVNVVNDIYKSDLASGYITLDNGKLDNIQLECPVLSDAILYTAQFPSTPAYTSPNNVKYYYNTCSAIACKGYCEITNSYISGGRAAIHVVSGTTNIENTTVNGGTVANIMSSEATTNVTLNNVTTRQVPTKATVNNTSKTVVGMGILVLVDDTGASSTITLEGDLKQYNWANSSYSSYIPSGTSVIMNSALSQTNYTHTVDGQTCINTGIAFMHKEGKSISSQSGKITDNRSNNTSVPYSYITGSAYGVYSYNNSNGTDENLIQYSGYEPTSQRDIEPTISVSNTNNSLSFEKKYNTTSGKWEYSIEATEIMDFAFDNIQVSKSGHIISISEIRDSNNAVVNKNSSVSLNDISTKNYTICFSDNIFYNKNGESITNKSIDYRITFQIISKVESINPPTLKTPNYEAGVCVASSYGETWHGAAPALQGIVITYYSSSQKCYVDLDLSTLTPNTSGKLNGTNTTWTYLDPNGDFCLTLTGGQVHSNNNIYAMPVVCNGKLYFVASSSAGLVNSGNSARNVPVSYSFTANNDTLPFNHTWSVSEDKNNEYKYSDFCNGTLTKLEASSGGGGGGGICISEGTLITLADGTQKAVENLTYGDELLSWDFYKGEYTSVPVAVILDHGLGNWRVLNLHFTDGYEIEIAGLHGFFDVNENKFVQLCEENYKDYIGHDFLVSVPDSDEQFQMVTLTGVDIFEKETHEYLLISAFHYDYIANGLLNQASVPYYDVKELYNYFEIGENMQFDKAAMQRDIETYGLYDYEVFKDIVTYEQFVGLNLQYLKISVGKGYLTLDELITILFDYVVIK